MLGLQSCWAAVVDVQKINGAQRMALDGAGGAFDHQTIMVCTDSKQHILPIVLQDSLPASKTGQRTNTSITCGDLIRYIPSYGPAHTIAISV